MYLVTEVEKLLVEYGSADIPIATDHLLSSLQRYVIAS